MTTTPRPSFARGSHGSLLDHRRGPLFRAELPDGRQVDVYEDDPGIDVPADALRLKQLEAASNGRDVRVVAMPYDQSGNG